MNPKHPIIEGLLELVYPTRCVVCEKPGSLICDEDYQKLVYIDLESACPRCGAPFGLTLCTECTTRHGPEEFAFSSAISMLIYDDRAEAIITGYKDFNERRLALELASLLAQVLPLQWRRWATGLSWIPADRTALQRRGFDHMGMLANELASRTGIPLFDLLVKQGRADQRVLTRAERRENAFRLFNIKPNTIKDNSVLPQRLILIDDVFTTGATLDAAATVLQAAGVSEIRTVTVARVW
ncbi:MAG: double zinc ribbon domain-containing protein [Coriobacteriales bacterium]|nr:double zinc ribbon domain-containing protein [Coriobacteriales bacterium]